MATNCSFIFDSNVPVRVPLAAKQGQVLGARMTRIGCSSRADSLVLPEHPAGTECEYYQPNRQQCAPDLAVGRELYAGREECRIAQRRVGEPSEARLAARHQKENESDDGRHSAEDDHGCTHPARAV